MSKATCLCKECAQRRADAARMRQIHAELPTPEFDWPALEAASHRARENPEWYKHERLANHQS